MRQLDVRAISVAEYVAFLETVPHSCFQRMEWLRQIEAVYKVSVTPIGYFDRDSLRAVTPLLKRRVGPFILWGSPLRRLPVPPATAFCAPASAWQQALPALRAWRGQQGLPYLQVTLPLGADAPADVGDATETLENLVIDLVVDMDRLWNNLSKLPKRCVRKAVRKGVGIHWNMQLDFMSTQQQLLNETYKQQGLSPNFPDDFYQALLDHRQELDLRILCATHGGKTAAAIWVLCDADSCYYWDAAARHEARDLNANHLLVWCLIRWAKKRGISVFDFVGSGGRAGSKPGIGRFKRSMGASDVTQTIVFWYWPLLRFALSIYRVNARTRVALAKSISYLGRPFRR